MTEFTRKRINSTDRIDRKHCLMASNNKFATLNQDIIAALDIESEYRELGVEIK